MRKLLPEFDQEALEPPHLKNKKATRSDRRPHGHHKTASGAALNAACDPIKDSHHGPARSIYGPRKQAMQKIDHQNSAHPNTGAPHTPYASPMRSWNLNFQRDSNPST